MDPDSNLNDQVILAKWIIDMDGEQLTPEAAALLGQQALALAESVLALNDWISKGGFLPLPWSSR